MAMYVVFYAISSLYFYLGFLALNVYPVSYWQCLGGLVIFRQLRAIVVKPGDNHVKDNTPKQEI